MCFVWTLRLFLFKHQSAKVLAVVVCGREAVVPLIRLIRLALEEYGLLTVVICGREAVVAAEHETDRKTNRVARGRKGGKVRRIARFKLS